MIAAKIHFINGERIPSSVDELINSLVGHFIHKGRARLDVLISIRLSSEFQHFTYLIEKAPFFFCHPSIHSSIHYTDLQASKQAGDMI